MNAANAAEAKTEALRKAARSVEQISATLQSKADTIRQLSQQVTCASLIDHHVRLTLLQGVHKALIDAEQKEMGSH